MLFQEYSVIIKGLVAVGVFVTGLTAGVITNTPYSTIDSIIDAYADSNESELSAAPLSDYSPSDTVSEFNYLNLPDNYFQEPAAPVQQPVNNYATSASPVPIYNSSANVAVSSSLSIPAIGLNNVIYDYGSMQNIPDIDEKLLYGPVRDTAYATELCTFNTHSYLMGHSEPAYSWQAGYPGAYIFRNLHKLVPGDKIYITNSMGLNCTYEVTGWEQVVTDNNDQVTLDVFNGLMFPDTSAHSILSIQTCQQGSATVRLILRAKMV